MQALEGMSAPPLGLAYDMRDDRLLLLLAANPARLEWRKPDGRALGHFELTRSVAAGGLAFDRDTREIEGALAGGAWIILVRVRRR